MRRLLSALHHVDDLGQQVQHGLLRRHNGIGGLLVSLLVNLLLGGSGSDSLLSRLQRFFSRLVFLLNRSQHLPLPACSYRSSSLFPQIRDLLPGKDLNFVTS